VRFRAPPVEILWKKRGFPVDDPTARIFLLRIAPELPGLHSVDAPSTVLSLEPPCNGARIQAPSATNTHPDSHNAVNVHRFEETINGRAYHIEVSSVGRNQWRAQIARVPGGSAAMMPFYGKTPDEAAHQLSRWLMVLHGQRSQL
jgi:hypothetical protein